MLASIINFYFIISFLNLIVMMLRCLLWWVLSSFFFWFVFEKDEGVKHFKVIQYCITNILGISYAVQYDTRFFPYVTFYFYILLTSKQAKREIQMIRVSSSLSFAWPPSFFQMWRFGTLSISRAEYFKKNYMA